MKSPDIDWMQGDLMKSFYPYLFVFLGGGLGAVLRYATDVVIKTAPFPLSTLLVNVGGSFLLGALFSISRSGAFSSGAFSLFFGVGLLGGFTTFSGFSLQSLKLLEQGHQMFFWINVVSTTGLSLLACWLGLIIAR